MHIVETGKRMKALLPCGLDQEGHSIHPEPGDPQLHPEPDDLLHLLPHPRVGDVQIRLEVIEAMEVVAADLAVERPRGLLDPGEYHALVSIGWLVLRPDVVIAEAGVAGPGSLEPRMLIRVILDLVL